jgi:sirohydrochlorin ferrochelatase
VKGILLIDHGSRRHAANDMLFAVAQLVETLAHGTAIVVPAHMEIAEPTVAQGFAECVRRGASEVVAVPYMLAPGRHVTYDIPALVAQAAEAFPEIPFTVASALGVHTGIARVVLERANANAPAPLQDSHTGYETASSSFTRASPTRAVHV